MAALLTVGLVEWRALRTPAPPELSFATRPCADPPVWSTGGAPENIKQVGTDYILYGLSYVETSVCRPGTLVIDGDGQGADGVGAELTVLQDGALLATEQFSTPRQVRIRATRAGRLQLAFTNDLYQADVRIVFFTGISFSRFACRLPNVTIPAENIGQWFADSRTGTLIRAAPMTVTACGAGTLTLNVSGQAGDGSYPVLVVEQAGQRLSTIPTLSKQRTVQVGVQAGPISIRVVNPFGRTVKDRNLRLLNLRFDDTP